MACWFSKDMHKRTGHLQRKELNPEISLFTCSTQECHGILIAVNGFFQVKKKFTPAGDGGSGR